MSRNSRKKSPNKTITEIDSTLKEPLDIVRDVKTDTRLVKLQKMVGRTTFTESRNLATLIPCERLYLKFEGNNPTGTQKDRIAVALANSCAKLPYGGITTASCGNFGAAIAYASNYYRIPEIHIFIPRNYHVPKSRLKIINDSNAIIHLVDGTYEEAVILSSTMARENNWFDANPGMNGTSEISINAYAEIAFEIISDLRRAPDYVLCPVGNGTTIAGIHLGFKKLFDSKRIPKLPKMVACSTRRGNPIVKSYKMKSRIIKDLTPQDIVETKINEPLTNWHSFDGQEALDALYESGGFAETASETKMLEFTRSLRIEEGLNVHPASACTLAVLAKTTSNNVMLKGTFICILTSRYT
ncbi:MAG: pyridoxal-phosphate dependent enzyme [Candidatus Heimdallarchaeota archaeon]|nr:pyridoxal-phosphate dependent enzyme [Candidatus Heimdallarchaeota archaeon]